MKVQTRKLHSLKDYLLALSQLPRLEPLRESLLLEEAAAGHEEAARELVEAYLPKVVSLAATYRGRGLEFRALIEIANRGLFQAMKRSPEGEPFERVVEREVQLVLEAAFKKVGE